MSIKIDIINTFLEKLACKTNIKLEELKALWEEHLTIVNNDKEKVEDNIDFSKCNVAELKALCKKRGFKVTGPKTVLLNRLLGKEEVPVSKSKEKLISVPKETKTSIVNKKIEEKNKVIEEKSKILNILKNGRPQIPISRNSFNNLEHKETGFVFNNDKIVIGKQNENGSINPLTEKDTEELNKLNFRYDPKCVSLYKQVNESDSDLASDEFEEEVETEEELEDEIEE